MASDRLQQGIYFRHDQQAPAAFRLLLLNAELEANGSGLANALSAVFEMLGALAGGHVRELEGEPETAAEASMELSELEYLIGFGRRLFDADNHAGEPTSAARPEYLAYLPQPENAFPAIPWAATENRGEADFALQLTGASEAAVARAAVEVWKLIVDEDLPLIAVASFGGFVRSDGRGWLEFHDGVSNIAADQRLAAIEARGNPTWIRGGTYLAFLRLAVDLRLWRSTSRVEQELIVGRDKLSGAPLVDVEEGASGEQIPVPAPAPRPGEAEPAEFRDPAQTTNSLLEASHIHRANQARASSCAPAGLRIFRQGSEFLDDLQAGEPRLGLNFVSFQSDLATLQHLLHLPGWLGDANFGGSSDSTPLTLIHLLAGGFYAVPPVGDPFPGAELFAE